MCTTNQAARAVQGEEEAALKTEMDAAEGRCATLTLALLADARSGLEAAAARRDDPRLAPCTRRARVELPATGSQSLSETASTAVQAV